MNHGRSRPRLAAIALTAVIVTACGSSAATSAPPAASGQPTGAPSATDAAGASPGTGRPIGFDNAVVTTEWLEANLNDPALRIIEVSTEPGVYERGHIPGAVNFVWHTDFVDTVTRDIVGREAFQALARNAGVNDESTIVLYGDRNNWFAAWGAWVFDIYGAADVRILDGGRVAWEAEKRAFEVAAPTPAAGTFTAASPNPALRSFLPDVLKIAQGSADIALVDIRSPDEFNGVIFAPEGFQELAVRAGHIPTAVNVPWGTAVAADGRFKPVDELRQIYAAAGIDGSRPVVVYCRIGERASHTWFVLSRILGYDVALYDGSWTEWGNTVGVPVENPAGTVWGAT